MKQFQQLFSLNENTLEIMNLRTLQHKKLTFNQLSLLSCLIEGKGRKSELMRCIWEENNVVVSDGSYHQLIFQTRSILEQIGLSAELIKTLPRYGLKLVGTEESTSGGIQLAEPLNLREDEQATPPDHKDALTIKKTKCGGEANVPLDYHELIKFNEHSFNTPLPENSALLGKDAGRHDFSESVRGGAMRFIASISLLGFAFFAIIAYLFLSSDLSYKWLNRIYSPPHVLDYKNHLIYSYDSNIVFAKKSAMMIEEWNSINGSHIDESVLTRSIIENNMVYRYVLACEKSYDINKACENYILVF